MTSYPEFLARKAIVSAPSGIAEPPELNAKLFEHQTLLTRWALRRGRAALFCDTGIGKGFMILEWARVVASHTGKPVLILAPLAVSQQFLREAEKLWTTHRGEGYGASIEIVDVELKVASSQSDVRSPLFPGERPVCPEIYVTNYQKLHKFDPAAFGGVALDESSILKSLDGKTRSALLEAFRSTPFKLSATATPSPNDHTELGGQAEFLGVMKHQEMLATFFAHDGGSTQDWRIKGHAREAFWRWCTSWGAIVKMPGDIGCSDEGYELPELRYVEHIIPATAEDAAKTGLLFAQPAEGLHEQRQARRGSLDSRVAKCAALANEAGGQVIVWCDLNSESQALTRAIKGAEEVTGSMTDDEKEAAIERFVSGASRVLISKPSICGWGLNLQFVNTVIFCGVSHSWEQFYQAIRRVWRYGQAKPVTVHIVSSELEGNVVANLKAKQAKAEELTAETRGYVSRYVRAEVVALERETLTYHATVTVQWPEWLRGEGT